MMVKQMIVPQYSFEDLDTFDEAVERLNSDRELVANRILEAVRYGLKNNLLSVYLFELKISSDKIYAVKCKREEWKSSLNNSRKFFESIEEYEKCAQVRDLILELEHSEIAVQI